MEKGGAFDVQGMLEGFEDAIERPVTVAAKILSISRRSDAAFLLPRFAPALRQGALAGGARRARQGPGTANAVWLRAEHRSGGLQTM